MLLAKIKNPSSRDEGFFHARTWLFLARSVSERVKIRNAKHGETEEIQRGTEKTIMASRLAATHSGAVRL